MFKSKSKYMIMKNGFNKLIVFIGLMTAYLFISLVVTKVSIENKIEELKLTIPIDTATQITPKVDLHQP